VARISTGFPLEALLGLRIITEVKHDVRLRDVKVEVLFESMRFDPRFSHLVSRMDL